MYYNTYIQHIYIPMIITLIKSLMVLIILIDLNDISLTKADLAFFQYLFIYYTKTKIPLHIPYLVSIYLFICKRLSFEGVS